MSAIELVLIDEDMQDTLGELVEIKECYFIFNSSAS